MAVALYPSLPQRSLRKPFPNTVVQLWKHHYHSCSPDLNIALLFFLMALFEIKMRFYLSGIFLIIQNLTDIDISMTLIIVILAKRLFLIWGIDTGSWINESIEINSFKEMDYLWLSAIAWAPISWKIGWISI